MQDRQDIDALLMGALYGELSPAETARLDEHLSAHPQDRLALEGLTRAREAIRDSHVLTFQLDPPAAVSALLLQEAARRAPAPRTEKKSALARFFAGFVAVTRHPAMAAAAVVVLVLGVASTVYLQNDAEMMNESRVASGENAAPSAGAAPSATPSLTPPTEQQQALDETVTGTDRGYRADLDTEPLAVAQNQDKNQAPSREEATEELREKSGDDAGDALGKKGKLAPPPPDVAAADPAPVTDERANRRSGGKKDSERPRGIAVTTPEPTIKTELAEKEKKLGTGDQLARGRDGYATAPGPSTTVGSAGVETRRADNMFDMSQGGQAPESDKATATVTAPPPAAAPNVAATPADDAEGRAPGAIAKPSVGKAAGRRRRPSPGRTTTPRARCTAASSSRSRATSATSPRRPAPSCTAAIPTTTPSSCATTAP